MGTGIGRGENRALEAAQQAISSPLLDNVSIAGATGVLINIIGGDDLTLGETTQINDIIHDAVGDDAEIIFGAGNDPAMRGEVRVTVIATGFDRAVTGDQPLGRVLRRGQRHQLPAARPGSSPRRCRRSRSPPTAAPRVQPRAPAPPPADRRAGNGNPHVHPTADGLMPRGWLAAALASRRRSPPWLRRSHGAPGGAGSAGDGAARRPRARPEVVMNETPDTLRRGETVSHLFARHGVDLDLSRARHSRFPSIPDVFPPGLVFSFGQTRTDSSPTGSPFAPTPSSASPSARTGDQLEHGGRADRMDSPSRSGSRARSTTRSTRRSTPRCPTTSSTPANGSAWPGTWPTCSPGRSTSPATSSRATDSRCCSSGCLARRRGAVRRVLASRPHDVRQASHGVPIRLGSASGLLRLRRQLASPGVPARAGPVPPHLLELRAGPVPSGARHHAPARGHRLRRRSRHAGHGGGRRRRLRAGRAGGYGNLIELRHRNGITTRYGHLRGFARGIRGGSARVPGPGDRLRRVHRTRDRAAPPLRVPGQWRRPRFAAGGARAMESRSPARSAACSSGSATGYWLIGSSLLASGHRARESSAKPVQ